MRALLLALLSVPTVAAAESYTVLPFASTGVDPDAVETFRALLAANLQADGPVVQDGPACADAACALDAGRRNGTDVVVFGSIRSLGSKVIVIATALETGDGSTRSSSSLTGASVEELDTIAGRVASAVIQGVPAGATAELGTLTERETDVDIRRKGAKGAVLRVGTVVPLEGHGSEAFGAAVELGYWFEARDFAIEPRVGAQFEVGIDDGTWWSVPFELGVYYLLSRSDFAPFLGGGGGLRYFYTSDPATVVDGGIVQVEREITQQRDGISPSAFGRAGAMLFRTYEVRVLVGAEYSATFVDGGPNPQSVAFTLGVVF